MKVIQGEEDRWKRRKEEKGTKKKIEENRMKKKNQPGKRECRQRIKESCTDENREGEE